MTIAEPSRPGKPTAAAFIQPSPAAPRPPRWTTRFAPSPTGRLHLGHVHAARCAHQAARDSGGAYLVRLEDLDRGRCTKAFEATILDDLEWLGLAPDAVPRRQSDHTADYAAGLARLDDAGLIYPCFCSRAEVLREAAAAGSAPHGPDGAVLYPGTCRDLPAPLAAGRVRNGEPHALRLRSGEAIRRAGPLDFEERGTAPRQPGTRQPCRPERFGDAVLSRRDGAPAYHLAVVLDDALQAITLVTRGEDLAPSTDLHRLLQTLLGLPAPVYAHHRLLTDDTGRRLAKRDDAAAIATLRRAGLDPQQVLALAG